jgi:hypothetical protein
MSDRYCEYCGRVTDSDKPSCQGGRTPTERVPAERGYGFCYECGAVNVGVSYVPKRFDSKTGVEYKETICSAVPCHQYHHIYVKNKVWWKASLHVGMCERCGKDLQIY